MHTTKTSQICVRLTDELAREFKAFCALQGTPLQFVLERFVKQFVEEKRKEKPA